MNPADPEMMEWTVVPQIGAAVKVDREWPTALFVSPLYLDGHFDPEDESEVDFDRAFDTEDEKKLWENLRDTLLALDKFYAKEKEKESASPILVWRFHDAPKEYRSLSYHGGDEDWVAFIPKSIDDDWIPWAEDGTPFGVCSVSRHNVGDGVVLIGAHA